MQLLMQSSIPLLELFDFGILDDGDPSLDFLFGNGDWDGLLSTQRVSESSSTLESCFPTLVLDPSLFFFPTERVGEDFPSTVTADLALPLLVTLVADFDVVTVDDDPVFLCGPFFLGEVWALLRTAAGVGGVTIGDPTALGILAIIMWDNRAC